MINAVRDGAPVVVPVPKAPAVSTPKAKPKSKTPPKQLTQDPNDFPLPPTPTVPPNTLESPSTTHSKSRIANESTAATIWFCVSDEVNSPTETIVAEKSSAPR